MCPTVLLQSFFLPEERRAEIRQQRLEDEIDTWEHDVTLADHFYNVPPSPPSPKRRSPQELFEAMSDSRKQRLIESLRFLRNHVLVSRRQAICKAPGYAGGLCDWILRWPCVGSLPLGLPLRSQVLDIAQLVLFDYKA